ncbi:MAG TPA: sigma-54 dependent transcriptional regulator [Bryobacteraceae bacterium]|nr:sigma-54 dependent transcriptional regulator [Bryobacteraceae bacterium]
MILIQSAESPDLAAVARAYGVSDYLREPISADDLVSSVRKCLGESRLPRPRITRATLSGGERMVGNSPVMAELRRRIASIAAADCNVLITGETGTGKELAAELIHTNGRRSQGRFVCVNCAAIPEMLLESELFGYEKGAFTGAHSTRLGQVELADGGILFLDEIGELSLHAQAKILRVIEGKEVARLGRRMGVRVDVRMVCATNRDLEAEVRKGTFRADLFFRLNVARLELPPLRERKADLRDLATHYLREFSAAMGLEVAGFTGDSWQCLLRHEWPGNVRELKNAVEASLVHLPYPRMRLAELPDELCRQFTPAHPEPSESDRLLNALAAHNWNKSKAAQDLRWSRMTLYRKMAKHQLSSSTRTQVRTA